MARDHGAESPRCSHGRALLAIPTGRKARGAGAGQDCQAAREPPQRAGSYCAAQHMGKPPGAGESPAAPTAPLAAAVWRPQHLTIALEHPLAFEACQLLAVGTTNWMKCPSCATARGRESLLRQPQAKQQRHVECAGLAKVRRPRGERQHEENSASCDHCSKCAGYTASSPSGRGVGGDAARAALATERQAIK